LELLLLLLLVELLLLLRMRLCWRLKLILRSWLSLPRLPLFLVPLCPPLHLLLPEFVYLFRHISMLLLYAQSHSHHIWGHFLAGFLPLLNLRLYFSASLDTRCLSGQHVQVEVPEFLHLGVVFWSPRGGSIYRYLNRKGLYMLYDTRVDLLCRRIGRSRSWLRSCHPRRGLWLLHA
jgi:hypothetical protein